MVMRLVPALFFIFLVAAIARSDEPSLFDVPEQELQMRRLSELFERHYSDPILKGAATLWDHWLVPPTIWYAGTDAGTGTAMREFWRHKLHARQMDVDGYVSTHQHAGAAHQAGWPFPFWSQAGGIGFHFSMVNIPYLLQNGLKPVQSTEGWEFSKCGIQSLDDQTGLALSLKEPGAQIASPTFNVSPFVAPFIGLEWSAEGLKDSDQPRLIAEFGNSTDDISVALETSFTPVLNSDGTRFTMIPLGRRAPQASRLMRLRIDFGNTAPATVTVKSLFTAVDSRHNINNVSYVMGCIDYARWTRDLAFLRQELPRIRRALTYAIDEFNVEEAGCVYTRWVGHDGRPGFIRLPEGPKVMLRGHGIGSNYWDLLPFGNRDTLATIYTYAALRRMAELEADILKHPEWNLPLGPERLDPFLLARLADRVQKTAQQIFWNPQTGRFVACVDTSGEHHDYGYTFVNLEAIHYGLASEEQAKQILAWIDGQRFVSGDTSQGDDIYHFRFAPRASTRRNIDWYMFAWNDPEAIPWGGQVQDGGAVLGFSYHDIMARLRVRGPDDSWRRLSAIAQWFDDVQNAGGYRKYYTDPSQGTLQGGGTAGGLGLDYEFVESVMVPGAIIDGFAGLNPTVDAIHINPQLPSSWSKLTIPNLQIHGHVIDVKVGRDTVLLKIRSAAPDGLRLVPPPGRWRVIADSAEGSEVNNHYVPSLGPGRPLTWDTSRSTTLTLERVQPGQ